MSESLASRLSILGDEICHRLYESTDAIPTDLGFVVYHGFRKSTLRSPDILDLAAKHGFSPDEVQIELVTLERPLPCEAHYHETTHAHVVILGKPIFREPESAWVCLGSEWSRAAAYMSIDIPPGIVHGFYMDSNAGALDFLSVQSPPLVRGDHDDFIVAKVSEPLQG